MQDLILKRADINEIDIVFSLLRDAAIWLKNQGIDYWQNWINPKRTYIDWIKEGFKNNEFFLVYRQDLIVGCFRLQWQDEVFWGKRDDQSGYIHSLTCSRKLANTNLGSQILKAIESHCRNKEKKYLRLDCGKYIDGLRRYYENQGFQRVGEVCLA